MPAPRPEDLCRCVHQDMAAGDRDAVLRVDAPAAVVRHQAGAVTPGEDGGRPALAPLAA
jgi:hypothetical protein